MVSRRDQPGQALLFGEGSVEPAAVGAGVVELGRRLPRELHLGTSSWAFPGWKGLIYARGASERELARHGLSAYAAHPLMRTVGLDRAFYAPPSEAQYRGLGAAVPEGFRFLVKAFNEVTLPELARGGGGNPRFLDARFAADVVVEPAVRGLGEKLGPILFQFSPMPLRGERARAEFIDRLGAFLSGLPRGPLYAVELRNRGLLTPEYRAMIGAMPRGRLGGESGVCHAFNIHSSMPPLEAQAALIAPEGGPGVVLRWMLRAGRTYEGSGRRYAPFDRMVEEDPGNRAAAAELCVRGIRAGRPVWAVANNNAEGCAPLTILRLAEAVDATLV